MTSSHIDHDVVGMRDGIGFVQFEAPTTLELGSPLLLILEGILHHGEVLARLAILDLTDKLGECPL